MSFEANHLLIVTPLLVNFGMNQLVKDQRTQSVQSAEPSKQEKMFIEVALQLVLGYLLYKGVLGGANVEFNVSLIVGLVALFARKYLNRTSSGNPRTALYANLVALGSFMAAFVYLHMNFGAMPSPANMGVCTQMILFIPVVVLLAYDITLQISRINA